MNQQRFQDRTQAGQLLAVALSDFASRPDLLVLGLPRGGIPVAFEIARALCAPLDVFVVRKLGVPAQEELAMGAIASGGICVLNEDVIHHLALSRQTIEQEVDWERREVARRERLYRNARSAPAIRDRTVILVDDGMATGATMRAAAAAVRQQEPAALVLAVPVAAAATCEEFEQQGEQVFCLLRVEEFWALAFWYIHFPQTTDEEVRSLLTRATHEWTLVSQQH